MQNKTTVVNCKRSKYDILITRGTKWGNPYAIGVDGNRQEVCEKYEYYVRSKPELWDCLEELCDKTLGCQCFPLMCHGNVLIKLLNEKLFKKRLKVR